MKVLFATQLDLAELLGADRNTVAAWTRAGMPVARRGKGSRGHSYNIGACVRWARARDRADADAKIAAAQSKTSTARERKLNADAERAELTTRQRAGELLPRDRVVRTFGEHVTNAKTRLLALPTALAARLLHTAQTGGAPAIQAVLEQAIREALLELAGAVPDEAPRDVRDSHTRAPAERTPGGKA